MWGIGKSPRSRNSAHSELQNSARDDVDLLCRINDHRFSEAILLPGPYRPVLFNYVWLIYRLVLDPAELVRENRGRGFECDRVSGDRGLTYRIRRDNYRNSFEPVVAVIKQNATAQSLIAANPGVAFGLGFPENVLNDPLFGYNSKKRFDYIVIDPETAYTIERSKDRDAFGRQVYDYTMRLLADEYRLLYDRRSYTIYARKSLPNLP